MVKILMWANSCLVSEWIAGKYNTVLDSLSLSLSRVTHLSHDVLTCLLHTASMFETKAMPTKINSWLLTTSLPPPKRKQALNQQPIRSQLQHGFDGKATSAKSQIDIKELFLESSYNQGD
jgi:hypothetical protein